MASKPLYIVAPAGTLRDAAVAAVAGDAEVFDPPLRAAVLQDRTPGVVLADVSDLGAGALVEAATTLKGPDWVFAVLEATDPPTVRTISSGHASTLADVAHCVEEDAEGPRDGLLELHRVLTEISRARHDINNPLTSALAETQILLLDVPEGEVREGLETVQTQLRRIRDLVAATRHLRPNR
jgi:signal transduction histidine kinase